VSRRALDACDDGGQRPALAARLLCPRRSYPYRKPPNVISPVPQLVGRGRFWRVEIARFQGLRPGNLQFVFRDSLESRSTTLMAGILIFKAREAPTKNYRKTEMWLYLPKEVRPPEAYARGRARRCCARPISPSPGGRP